MKPDRYVNAAPTPPSGSSGGPQSPRLLTAIAVSGLFSFIVLTAALVAVGPSNRWDVHLDEALRSVRTPFLDSTLFVATYLCSWQVVVAGVVTTMIYLIVVGQRRAAAALLVSVIGDLVIVSTLKNVFSRARPDQLKALLPASGPSFPSGHTFAAVAFYGVLALIAAGLISNRATRRSTGAAAALFIIVVGYSRVYLGAHWPSDVLGSWLLGVAWLAAIGIGLEIAGKRFPSADHGQQGTRNRRLALGLFVLWLAFVLGVGFVQPKIRQSESLAQISADELGVGRSCASMTRRSCAVHAFATLPRVWT